MITTDIRRGAGQRVSAAVWGLLVIGAGVTSMLAYSGYEIDLELAAIILLASVGGWLLLTSAISGLGRRREVAAATAPVVEEPSDAVDPGADEAVEEPAVADEHAADEPAVAEEPAADEPAVAGEHAVDDDAVEQEPEPTSDESEEPQR
ncbi:hypothetical protein [Demequina sp.]|uniref:hypothetical protein n=1 Tax=Demequina sp. TaxID=2050685 RepID=UPI003A8529F9